MRLLPIALLVAQVTGLLLSLTVKPSFGAYWLAGDNPYISGTTSLRIAVSFPLGSPRTDDTGPVKVPRNVPITFKVYESDENQPVGNRLESWVCDIDSWSDPADYNDTIESKWTFGGEPTETVQSFYPSITRTFANLGTVAVGWSIQDLGYKYDASLSEPERVHDSAKDVSPLYGTKDGVDAYGVLNIEVVNPFPSTPEVTDDGVATNSTVQLHARWSSTEEVYGIAGYYYAIGTKPYPDPAYESICGFTSARRSTSVTHTVPNSLTPGTTYYFAVKAVSRNATASLVGVSDGITVDTTPPTVTDVTSSNADGAYGSGREITVQITFSEPVNVTGTPQIDLETGTTDRQAVYLNGSGTSTLTFVYVVQPGDSSQDLDYIASTALGLHGGTIKDLAGNDAGLTLPSPGALHSLASNKNIQILPGVENVTIHVKRGGSDSNSGASWNLAKATIQNALDEALSGDEIWVAGATAAEMKANRSAYAYVESIVLKDGVKLYGGFHGEETSLDERDSRTNVTIIDACGLSACVVLAGTEISSTTVLDGFTITGGTSSGIRCLGSPIIFGNKVTGNSIYGSGGGVYCASGNPSILANVIVNNMATQSGGGIFVEAQATPLLINNTIVKNEATDGGGVYIVGSAQITNNTVADNIARANGGGIYRSYDSALLSNNIIAFNSSGVYAENTSGIQGNCTYGNAGYGYSHADPDGTNIALDPKFTLRPAGDYGLSADSPCIDAGIMDQFTPSVDQTGRSRPFDGNFDLDSLPDIGQHEYRRFYVKWDASGIPGEPVDGTNWSKAYLDIKSAVDHALPAEAVWVADGVYDAAIALKPGVGLYGGFDGSESSLLERNPQSFQTTINGGVTVVSTASSTETVVDGFNITGGHTYGGIYSVNSCITIHNNRIIGNQTMDYPGAGIGVTGGRVNVYRNFISQNTNAKEAGFGGGISCANSEAWIACNVISDNTADGGAGISCNNTAATVINNTMVGNDRVGEIDSAGAVAVSGNAAVMIANNIIAFNPCGGITALTTEEFVPRLLHNNVYNNETNYLPDFLVPDEHSLSLDPIFTSQNDYHLQPDSPCIGHGDVTVEPRPEMDIDGRPRIMPPIAGQERTDVGAYESDPAGSTVPIVIDDGLYTSSRSHLHAVWWFAGFEGEVAEYQYAIGTSPTDPGSGGYLVDWISAGTAMNATQNLSLMAGKTYYWYVKAKSQEGQLSAVGVSDGITVGDIFGSMTYGDDPDSVKIVHGNGTESFYSYDEWNRVREIRHDYHNTSPQAIVRYKELDGVGNRKNIEINGSITLYGYDELSRLVSVNGSRIYEYDWVGNRTIADGDAFYYNKADQLLIPGVTYWGTGSLWQVPGTMPRTYTYDYCDMLSTVAE